MSFEGTLYPFQEEAVDRMITSERILVAFEMGLGKTVISICAAEDLIEAGLVGGVLICCPDSLKFQWKREILKFTNGKANVAVVDGDPERRARQYLQYASEETEYLIFNYNQLVNDWATISKLPRDIIIGDEITAIKNFAPQRSRRLKKLKATYQWGLTGQPIENRAEELFSIMQWINDEVLGDHETFERSFISRKRSGKLNFHKNLPTLHRLISEVMVRHTREEVKDQLPAVVGPIVIPVEFDVMGAKTYNTISRELQGDLEEAFTKFGTFDLARYYAGDSAAMEMQGRIMAKLTILLMLSDHPELVRISAAKFNLGRKGQGSAYAAELEERGLLSRLKQTPKLNVAKDRLTEILESGNKNKVVLFSHYKDMLRLIQEQTTELTKSVQFTGDMNSRQKDAAKQQFTDDPATRLFLSSDAGGYGVDLPMANFLVSYDLPWSGGAWDQRNSRIVRLSSQFPEVTLLSTGMEGSVEEYQYDRLTAKKAVASAIIDGKGIDSKGRLVLDLQSLSEFLRTHAV